MIEKLQFLKDKEYHRIKICPRFHSIDQYKSIKSRLWILNKLIFILRTMLHAASQKETLKKLSKQKLNKRGDKKGFQP